MTILIQFALRLSFGLALATAIMPPRLVSSGYYRNNSYVLLGLSVLGGCLSWMAVKTGSLCPGLSADETVKIVGFGYVWLAGLAAGLSYAAAVAWLYEKPRLGIVLLVLVAVITLCLAVGYQLILNPGDMHGGIRLIPRDPPAPLGTAGASRLFVLLDPLTGGLVLGTTMAAMLLGHWYLNAPGMQLAPLRRLVLLMGGSLFLRALVCTAGLMLLIADSGLPGQTDLLFITLRWLAGLVAAAGTAWMTWRILKIPNTQSATGVLYVAVIVTFVGELTAQLLAAKLNVPV